MAPRPHRYSHPICKPDRDPGIPRGRTPQCRGKTLRRPLHLTAEIPPHLGHRASVRLGLCDLRLVRRASELHQLRGLQCHAGSGFNGFPSQVASRPCDRQRHPHPSAWHLLAGHAPCTWIHRRTNSRPPRAWMVEYRGREDEQEPRQYRGPLRACGEVWLCGSPILPLERHHHRTRCRLQ